MTYSAIYILALHLGALGSKDTLRKNDISNYKRVAWGIQAIKEMNLL